MPKEKNQLTAEVFPLCWGQYRIYVGKFPAASFLYEKPSTVTLLIVGSVQRDGV